MQAAQAAFNQFVNAEIPPDQTVEFDLMQNFGYGTALSMSVESEKLIVETPPMSKEGRSPGAKWEEIYKTKWPGVYRIRGFYKHSRDEFNVQFGSDKLVKMGTQKAAEFESWYDPKLGKNLVRKAGG